MDHKIENGFCVNCGASHGDIVTKLPECFIPAFPARRRVAIIGAPKKVVTSLKLEAVGLKWDGSLVPIGEMQYSAGPLSLDEVKRLAAASKFRTFRIPSTEKTDADGEEPEAR